jgi:hypothetical protein
MLSQLAHYYVFALSLPLIWGIVAYLRGAYYCPQVRNLCVLAVIVLFTSGLLLYLPWSIGRSDLSSFWLYVFMIFALFQNNNQFIHRKIFFFEPLTDAGAGEAPNNQRFSVRTGMLFSSVVLLSGMLFFGGMYLIPCAQLDLWLKSSGCRSSTTIPFSYASRGALSFAPDSRSYATFYPHSVSIGDVATNTVRHSLESYQSTDHAWSSDSATLAVGVEDNTVHVYDVQTGELRRELTLPITQGLKLTYLANTQQLAVLGNYQPLTIWDTQTGSKVAEVPIDSPWQRNALSSPDGRWLAVAADAGILLYDTTTWQVLTTRLPGDYVGTWSADSRQLVAYEGYELLHHHVLSANQQWQTTTVQDARSFGDMRAFFDANGKLFLLRSYFLDDTQNASVQIRDLTTQQLVFERRMPYQEIIDTQINPNRATLGFLKRERYGEAKLELWDARLP